MSHEPPSPEQEATPIVTMMSLDSTVWKIHTLQLLLRLHYLREEEEEEEEEEEGEEKQCGGRIIFSSLNITTLVEAERVSFKMNFSPARYTIYYLSQNSGPVVKAVENHRLAEVMDKEGLELGRLKTSAFF